MEGRMDRGRKRKMRKRRDRRCKFGGKRGNVENAGRKAVIKWLAWLAFVDVRILGLLRETPRIG
jgi:hypothetical protein